MLVIPEPPIPSARIGLRLLRPGLNRAILVALSRPMGIGELCAALMLESDTSLREGLEDLEGIGAIERCADSRRRNGQYRLAPAGDHLLRLMTFIGGWLSGRPGTGLSPESDVAWRAFATLGDGWELSVIQHLVLRPSTRVELAATVPCLGSEKTKRLVRRLWGAEILGPLDRDARVRRYAVTPWARRSIGVLAGIAAWERRHLGEEAQAVAASDGALALLASLPLVRLPGDAAGTCAFTVEGPAGGAGGPSSAVWSRVTGGRIIACQSGTSPGPPRSWVRGDVDAWLDAVIARRPTALHLGGDVDLAAGLIRGLNEELFGGASLLL
jgi:DNA-binding HxlR family transcriptional regulator